MQIRRVLLLFALVLGLSALVASIAPAPEERDEGSQEAPATTSPAPGDQAVRSEVVQLTLPPPGARIPTRRVEEGSSFTLAVSVPEPGDVLLEGLGLRQTADPLTPARFDLLAEPAGGYDVAFVPLGEERRVAGRIEFGQRATVTPPQRDR